MPTTYGVSYFKPSPNTSSNSCFCHLCHPRRITSLDHEFLDNAVEDHTFKASALGMTDKVHNGQRRLLWEQPDVDIPKRCVDCTSPIGERRRACGLQHHECCSCPFLSCGALTENVSIMTQFVPGGQSVRHTNYLANVQDETHSGSECTNTWNCYLPYPLQNSVGSLTDFLDNRELTEAAIAYNTPSKSGIFGKPDTLTMVRLFFAGCP
jgi:hypothetical protein